MNHSGATCLSLYKIWHSNRHGIIQLTEQKIRENCRKGNSRYADVEVENPVSKTGGVMSTSDLSLPLPQLANTRGNQVESMSTGKSDCWVMNEASFFLTSLEWKEASSRTHQKVKHG
jgi:hypothetical protein